jgi:pimeloyl-ACP methyl ester carboxylesterase
MMVPVDGLELAVWEWPGADPPLLFVHATGFHGRCWDSIIRALPGRRALAVELRGHGRSAKPDPPYRWRAFGCDLAALAGRLELRGATGAGHSSGGHALVLLAALAPDALAELLIIDPTIYPPERYGQPPVDASFTLRRKNHWHSVHEMIERLRSKPAFAAWRPEILRDYCEYGLLPQGNHFVLACPPAVETSIYTEASAPESNLYPEIAGIQHPVTVLRAGKQRSLGVLDLSASPTAPDLAHKFSRGRDILLEDHSHYIPMEDPEAVIKLLNG